MSNVLKKKIKIYPNYPIHVNKDLYITRAIEEPFEMSVGNIEMCMLLSAKVFEVLEDGTEIMLYSNNYRKDNSELQKSLQEKENVKTPIESKITPPPVDNKTNIPVNTVDNKVDQKVDESKITPPPVDNKTNIPVNTVENKDDVKIPVQDNKDKK